MLPTENIGAMFQTDDHGLNNRFSFLPNLTDLGPIHFGSVEDIEAISVIDFDSEGNIGTPDDSGVLFVSVLDLIDSFSNVVAHLFSLYLPSINYAILYFIMGLD